MTKKRAERKKDFSKMPTFAEMKAAEENARENFFGGINQLTYEDSGYSCKWPICYREQSGVMGVFRARHRVLKRMLPSDPGIRPIQILPGVSVIAIAALESRVTDIGPYNSILVVVPIKNPTFIGHFSPLDLFPGFEFVRQGLLRKKYHWFIWRIPDDSYISYKVGFEPFGMPKFSCDMIWEDLGNCVQCSAMDEEIPILNLRMRKLETITMKKGAILNTLAYFYRDKLPMTEECKFLLKEFGISFRGDDLKLELGQEHPMAQELKEALITTRPFASFYLPQTNLLIHEPGRWAADVLGQFFHYFNAKQKKVKR